MTEQQKQFADEFIFLKFNSNETAHTKLAEKAAAKAFIDLPKDLEEREKFCKEILNVTAVKAYIATQSAMLKKKLSGQQRRNLWAAILEMNVGEPVYDLPDALPLNV